MSRNGRKDNKKTNRHAFENTEKIRQQKENHLEDYQNSNHQSVGQHEALPKLRRVGAHEEQPINDSIYEDDLEVSGRLIRQSVVKVKKKHSLKDILIKISSIAVSFVIIVLLVFNMPIIAYTTEVNGEKVIENVSIITFIKRWQPLVEIEGKLSSVVVSDIDSDVAHDDDGLDLPQIIEGQYTVLFLGFDESSQINDVNWLFQFDIGKGTMNVLQIPRDTFMPSYTSSSTAKFNSIYACGDSSVSPIQRVVNAVQENFGIPVDSYVTTNCYDIVSIVDLIGGIPITLDEQMMYEGDKIIPAGDNVLTGEQAEWFVRYRRTFKGEGDISRMKHQRKFLAAAMTKMLNIVEDEGQAKFYSYLKKIYENQYVLTDMSLEEISMLADFGSNLDLENVQVHLLPGEGAWYYPSSNDCQSVWSIHKQAALDIINENFRPYQLPLTNESSSMYELVTDYLNTSNDSSSDNLEDVKSGDTKTPMIDSYKEWEY